MHYEAKQNGIKFRLTTDHAASSHGIPAVIIDGEAVNPSDWLRTDAGWRIAADLVQDWAREHLDDDDLDLVRAWAGPFARPDPRQAPAWYWKPLVDDA